MDSTRIAQRAAANHGVLTAEFLAESGVTAGQMQRRVRRGEWVRLHRGVYALAGVPESFEMLATAALAALPGGVLSHQSAGRLHGVIQSDDPVTLTVPHGTRNRLAGAKIHQSDLPSSHTGRRRGLRCTSLERTLVDLAAVLGLTALQRCVEDQLLARTTTAVRLESTFLELAQRGRPGAARMRDVLAEIDGVPPTESELEAMFVRLVKAHGLAAPSRQATFDWSSGEQGRVDFWYPAEQLIVELDGRTFHARSAAFELDRRRDQLALMRGIRTVRFTHRQVTTEPAHVVLVIRALLTG